jgi:hypothetical protein
MSTKPPIGELSIQPVDLKVALTVTRAGKVESCCNYDITGKSGNLLLVLPPMTHIQDMPR